MARIALDWDGCLVDEKGEWLPGAVSALRYFRKLGYKVIIFSCKGSWDAGHALILMKLRDTGLGKLVEKGELIIFTTGGKPRADFYVDNRGIHFPGGPSGWNEVRKVVKERRATESAQKKPSARRNRVF